MPERYPIPLKAHRVSEKIKKSRFIATLAPAAVTAEAKALIEQVKAEFSDATHNCWAFVAGAPGSTAHIGMSDDGEPHGTAGKPMLQVLLHSGLGEIAVVVTRYFGGTKLGTGGLVRAYSGIVNKAIASMPVKEKFIAAEMTIRIDYAQWSALKPMAELYGASIIREEYKEDVSIELRLPEERAAQFIAAVKDRTNGQAIINVF